MCIILFQFLKQQVEFVNENNISDMEQASMTNQDPGQRFRRIRQANQDVSRPSIVEPSLKEQVCSHFKILIFLYVCTLDILFSSNHNIHKSLCGLCFKTPEPLIDRFY